MFYEPTTWQQAIQLFSQGEKVFVVDTDFEMYSLNDFLDGHRFLTDIPIEKIKAMREPEPEKKKRGNPNIERKVDYDKVIEMYKSGIQQKVIATELGCSQGTVSKIINGYKTDLEAYGAHEEQLTQDQLDSIQGLADDLGF